MKRWGLTAGLTLMLLSGTGSVAEAGLGQVSRNLFTYAARFVTCAINRGSELLNWVIGTGQCALDTVNTNPVTLNRIIPNAEVVLQ